MTLYSFRKYLPSMNAIGKTRYLELGKFTSNKLRAQLSREKVLPSSGWVYCGFTFSYGVDL